MIIPEQVEQLTGKFGRVKVIEYNGHELVLRKPTRMECKDHLRKSEDEQTKNDADEQLTQLLIVYFDGTSDPVAARIAFNAMLEDFPYAVKSKAIGGALSRLTGVVQDDDIKKPASGSPPSGTNQASSQTG